MLHSFGHSLNCDNEFDEMSDLTVNTTDIKCRVYVAKFLCAQCLCLHGKLLFLCVSGTNISSWIGEVLFMCWQCLMERQLENFLFSYKSCTYTSWCFLFFYIFLPRSLWMQMFTYLFVLSEWHCRSRVRFTGSSTPLSFSQLLSVSHILFSFFHSQSFLFLYILSYPF